MELSPRARVAGTINGEDVDRMPVDFWAVPEVYKNLARYLQMEGEEILRFLEVDCRVIAPRFIGPKPRRKTGGIFFDTWGIPRRRVSNRFSTYEEYAGHPLADIKSRADVEVHEWPRPEWWDASSFLDMVRALNKEVPYSIRFEVGGIFETAWALRGLERFLLDLVQTPELPYRIMERVTDTLIARAQPVLERAAAEIDIVYTYDDIGTQNGLFVSPDHWAQYIKPHHKRLNAFLRQYDVKIMYHSCGSIMPLLEELIDLPIDILNPLQLSARGMDARTIVERFGTKVAFHGGIDIQHTLRLRDREKLHKEVATIKAELGAGKRYIMAPTHFVQADIPPPNIVFLYREVERRPEP